MARASAAWVVGALLVIASASAACGSFDASNAPAPNDGGPDVTTANDDAGPPTEDAGGNTFCATNEPWVFCDDFEQPARDLSVATPWDDAISNGSQGRAVGPGNASPTALRVTGTLTQGDETTLSKLYDIHGKKVRFAFDVKVDKLVKLLQEGTGNPHVGIAGIVFPNGKELVVFFNGLGSNKISGFVRNALGGTVENVDFDRPAVEPSIGGGWYRLTIEFEPAEGVDRFRFFFGPLTAPALVLTLDADPAIGASALTVGTRGSSVDTDVDISIDNVLVTTF